MHNNYIFYIIIIITSFFSCSSAKNTGKYNECNDPLYLWKKEISNNSFNKYNDSLQLITSLGFYGSKSNYKNALDTARIEAEFNFTDKINLYINSRHTTITEYYKKNGNSKFIDRSYLIYYDSSSVNIRPDLVSYEEIDRKHIGSIYYVAVIAILNREKYFSDYVNIIPYSELNKNDEIMNKVMKDFNNRIKKQFEEKFKQ